MASIDQWSYGALFDFWTRWNRVRCAVFRKRPRRVGRAIAFLAAMQIPFR